MLIATFGPTTDLAGKKITREGEAFMLEGHGPISAADVMEYDKRGRLVWANDGTRAWIGSLAASGTSEAAAPVIVGTNSDGRRVTYSRSMGTFAIGDALATSDQIRGHHLAGELTWHTPETEAWFETSFPPSPEAILDAIRAELATESSAVNEPGNASKLQALSNLASAGIIEAVEFEAMKAALIQHWSQTRLGVAKGRFGSMWEQAQQVISTKLVAPASARYPVLESSMAIFDDCAPGEFVIEAFVDSQARSSALLRTQVRAKFNVVTGQCLGVSLWHDTAPPWQKMAWSKYEL